MTNDSDKSPNLDVLRSLAVGIVVVAHTYKTLGFADPPGYKMQALGILGVLMFFVHTSLVLMFSLQRQADRYGDRGLLVIFIARRIARIYPLSIAVVLALVILDRVTGADAFGPRIIAANLLLVQNVTGDPSVPSPLWSLPYELQMYFLLPWLFLLATRSPRPVRTVAVAWVLATMGVLGVGALGGNYDLIKYVPCFIPGVLAFAIWPRPRSLPFAALLLCLGVLAMVYPVARHAGVRETLGAWPVCLALGIVLPLCRDVASPTVQRVASVVARYSYGIYLIHEPCLDWFLSPGGVLRQAAAPVRWLAFAAATAVLSWAVFHLIEDPALKWGHRLIDRWARSRSAGGRHAPSPRPVWTE